MATLIESLSALAIFAIGASASATWLAQSTVRSSQASARVSALAVATDMEARLRANPRGVGAGDYQYAIPAAFDCSRACSPAEVAAVDLAAFGRDVKRAMGERATGVVTCHGGVCLIRIIWPGGRLEWGMAP